MTMIGKTISDPAEDLLESFDGDWSPMSPQELHALLDRYGLLQDVENVVEFIRIEVERRYEQSLSVDLAAYLDQFSCLSEQPTAVAEIAFEDYRCRTAKGIRVTSGRYRGLPGVAEKPWFMELERMSTEAPDRFAASRPRDTERGTTLRDHWILPPQKKSAGASVEQDLRTVGFEIIKRLGTGAFSDVYLATQNDLADRYVVLKVVDKPLEEPQKLAMLQHTNIVPIYSFHRVDSRSVICMPYAGGVTLAEFLKTQLQPTTRVGQSLVATVHDQMRDTVPAESSSDLLAQSKSNSGAGAGSEGGAVIGPLERLRDFDCSRLATWIFQRLASGLAHSHARGILHGDLKPANVLIRNDGEPAILDFNLSRLFNESVERRVGGTLPYMPPEAYRNLIGVVAEPIAASDIYSLGVMLFEFLTGRLPYPSPPSSAATDLELAIAHRREPIQWSRGDDVSPGLRSIITKCLAYEPLQRYASADALHADLVCEYEDRSLEHAPEPLVSRAGKWSRRHPRSITSAVSIALLAAILIPGVLAATTWKHQAAALESKARFAEFQEQSDDALAALIVDPLRSTEQSIGKAMVPLFRHRLLEERALREVLETPGVAEQDLDKRRSILYRHLAHVAWMEADRLEDAGARDAMPAQEMHRFDKLLDAIESVAPHQSSRALTNLRAERARLAGDEQLAQKRERDASLQPMSSDVERYLEAVRLQAKRKYRASKDLLTALVDRESIPSAIRWTMLGRSQLHIGDYEGAKLSFTQSLEHAPAASRLWHLRALAYRGLRQFKAAYEDYTKALELEPDFSSARWGRAQALMRMGEHEKALEDMDEGLRLRPDDPTLLMVRHQLLSDLGRTEQAERDFERAVAQEGLNAGQLFVRASNRMDRDPEGALEDLMSAAKRDRNSPKILKQTATALTRLGRLEEAIEVLEKVESIEPDNEKVIVDRAVLLARLNRTTEALAAHDQVVEPPTSPEVLYQAACVNALSGDTTRYQTAVVQLAKAIQGKFGLETLKTDPDLSALHGRRGFESLVQTVSLARMGRQQEVRKESDPLVSELEFAEPTATD